MSDLPEKIRAFIAVRIPDSVRVQIGGVQQQLKRELRDVSWTRPDAMHLTLQFLGNVESARLLELETALRGASRSVSPFDLAVGRTGSFGDRVIWVGVELGEKSLQNLAESVRQTAQPFAEREEARDFNGHVTLGRLRRPNRRIENALRQVLAPSFPKWTVREFELIRSELSPQGSRYTTLATIPLGGPAVG